MTPSEIFFADLNATYGSNCRRSRQHQSVEDGICARRCAGRRHLHHADELLWEMPVTTVICNWWGIMRNLSISRSPPNTNYDIRHASC
ncbi:hypothetical protein ACNKHV_14215 [Shigella flexneri]